MSGRHDNGGKREGARANERNARGHPTTMRGKNIELEKRELQVIRVIRKDRQVMNGILKGSQNGREMNFKKRLSGGAETDEMSPHGLKWLRQRGDIKARGGRGARED